jgi:hypothetical protein
MTGARVHQAGRDLAAEGVVQAGLVAADAGVDLIGFARSGLGHEVGVGQEGARHAHHVGVAFGQHGLGHLGRVDAVGGHQRDAHLALELFRHPGKRGTRHLGGNGGNAGLVPADAGVQDGDAGFFERLRQLDHLAGGRAAFDQVEHGEAEDDDEVGAHPLAGAAHDFQREADAVFIAAAPFVVAVVGVGGDELVDQVALGAHDLHAVIAGTLGQRGRIDVVLDRLLDLGARQRMGSKRTDRRLHRTRRHQLGVVGIAAEMQDLHADLAAGVMHGLRDHLVFFRLGRRGHGRAAGHGPRPLVRGNAAGHDQAHAATGALGIERGHAREAVFGLFKPHVHGAHEHPVLQGGETQVQGREQVGVG